MMISAKFSMFLFEHMELFEASCSFIVVKQRLARTYLDGSHRTRRVHLTLIITIIINIKTFKIDVASEVKKKGRNFLEIRLAIFP